MKSVKVQHFRMKTIQKSVFGIPGKKLKNGCGVLFLFLGILSFFVCLLQAFGQDIWFDEVFSVNFIQHSYKEIAALTGKDVHPPLYYWYLKLFHDIGKVLVPAASSIVLCIDASLCGNLRLYTDSDPEELRTACCRAVLVPGNDHAADLQLYSGDPDVFPGIVFYYGCFRT